MTREAATKIVERVFMSDPGGMLRASRWVEVLLRLGVLQLDESPDHSKEIVELIRSVKVSIDYVMSPYLSIQSTYDILDALRSSGYEIKKAAR